MAGPGNDNDRREARRILERVSQETEPTGRTWPVARAAKGAHDHFAAADIDRDDRIEYWGTRIGRAIGLLAAVAMMVWLGLFLLNHG